jgi:hypothetical protein
MNYTYKLYTKRDGEEQRGGPVYTREELAEMTTFQLRNICHREKLVQGLTSSVDREGLIQTILKYRSAEVSLLIQAYQPSGFERLEKVLRQYLNTPLPDNGSIQIPARLTLYAGLRVDKLDQYRVKAGHGISESNVLLVNENMELCGILNLIKDGTSRGVYCLTAEKELEFRRTGNKNYSFLFFRKQDSEYIYRAYYEDKPLLPVNLHYYKIPVMDLEIRELEETETVLAIDLGTSNTTAGAYLDTSYISSPCDNDLLNGRTRLNAVNFVSFPNNLNKEEEWIELLPTMVSAQDCSDPDNVKYHFGYDAMKYMKKNGYSSHATVFHGIKRWVNSYHKIEEMIDAQGNTAYVKRSDILGAYIRYVVSMAEQQFKCRFKHLHISSPVKLKTQFNQMYAEILPEYQIETEHALDEGMSVLYNTIADQIEKDSFMDGETYKALVIDCGGGTTDLSSCQFRIEEGHISYKIDIETTYENGDTNFGGNNITYRILQFMKIVFAGYYRNGGAIIDIDSLIDIPRNEVFRYVDELGPKQVYERFEEAYLEAERVIPTRFKEYENRTRDEYLRVRNNFYFLWDIAENMKKEFFRKTGILRNRFHSDLEHSHENDLKITAVDRWCLAVFEGTRLKDRYECPDVVFNIKEIDQLIRGDIYEIVRKFLDDFYRKGKLQEYSIIKLTGQSCRIDVFREALKEFVPGRSIEFRQKSEDNEKVPDLKLSCLRGAIRYLNAKKSGSVEVDVTNHAPMIPYSVSAFTHTRQERMLISSHERLNQVLGSISRPDTVGEVDFYLKDSEGNVRHRYVYRNQSDSYKPVLYHDIAALTGAQIPQVETDSITNGEVKLFVFTGDQHWGFHIVPIARRQEQLYLGKKQYFAFETDLSELDFFDGLK